MAKEWYRDINFRAKSLRMIDTLNGIITSYQKQGLKLTLRQVYYQCVVRNLFPNSERSYKNLGNLISDARLAGLMDWDSIEDRVRRPRVPSEFSGVEQLIETASYWYRLPRWEGQVIEAIEGPPRREVRFERMCVPAIGSPRETETLRMKDPMFNRSPTTKGEPK